jgi:hypothetical protein
MPILIGKLRGNLWLQTITKEKRLLITVHLNELVLKKYTIKMNQYKKVHYKNVH